MPAAIGLTWAPLKTRQDQRPSPLGSILTTKGPTTADQASGGFFVHWMAKTGVTLRETTPLGSHRLPLGRP
jgi:hypothetical protein